MAGFWLAAASLTLVAVAFLLVPLWMDRRESGRKTFSGQLVAIAVIPVAVLLYFQVTTFDADVESSVAQQERATLEGLAARLSADPTDVNGWVLLGRSYIQLGDYGRARMALEEAWNRTDEADDLLKLAYAQTLLITEEGSALTLAGDLVEDVLQNAPGNQNALFWGGFVASERNQLGVAAERWTALLATNPPPEIASLVREQIMLLTGSPVAPPTVAEASGPVIEIDVSLAASISLDSLGPAALLFVIASSNDSPAPVAVERHPLSALPGRFSLSDADAMMPTRMLSQYDEVTIVARISRSGQPTAQSGDVFAEAEVDPRSGEIISLVMDQIVP